MSDLADYIRRHLAPAIEGVTDLVALVKPAPTAGKVPELEPPASRSIEPTVSPSTAVDAPSYQAHRGDDEARTSTDWEAAEAHNLALIRRGVPIPTRGLRQ